MNEQRCKYSTTRLSQIVQERGLVSAVQEIEPSAIADPEIRRIWKSIRDNYDKLEDKIRVVAA